MAKPPSVAKLFQGKTPKSLWGGATKEQRAQYACLLGAFRKRKACLQPVAKEEAAAMDLVSVHIKLLSLYRATGNRAANQERIVSFFLENYCKPQTNKLFRQFILGVYSKAGINYAKLSSGGGIRKKLKKISGKGPLGKEKLNEILEQIKRAKEDLSAAYIAVKNFSESKVEISPEMRGKITRRYSIVRIDGGRRSLEEDIRLSTGDFLGNASRSAQLSLTQLKDEVQKLLNEPA
ncbi:MAG: hypothetical protein V1494_06535 [Candidatus Diapherotrites archaeon]